MKKETGLLPFFLIWLLVGCGKKGPPLPPLVRLPVAPADFSVQRRGSTVDIQFAVPSGNTDGSTPADLTRVDVYAATGPSTLTLDEIVKRGTRVGRILVNPPNDPDASEEEAREIEGSAPPGGVDQGVTARVAERFSVDADADPTTVRSYVAVGFNKRGRRGAYSPRLVVPTGTPPEPPGAPEVTWDETTIAVTLPEPPAEADMPPMYHVYAPGDVEIRLTDQPLVEGPFVDKRIEWGAERCYVVRSVERVEENVTLESEASSPTCVTLRDTFPPAAPVGLTIVAAEGAVNLIWDPNREADLAGYLVLRAVAPETTLVALTPAPVVETTFKDTVPAGARVTYAVSAVDTAGNASPTSVPIEETAR